MSASRLARLARRLAGRRWWHQGRWRASGPRWRVSTGVRLSDGASMGWQGPQAVQGPRAPAEVQAPRWAHDAPVGALQLAARALPELTLVTNTVPELKGLDA